MCCVDGLQQAANTAVARLPGNATLLAVERLVAQSLRRECRAFNQRRPEVIVIAHEHDATSLAAKEACNDDPALEGGLSVCTEHLSHLSSHHAALRVSPARLRSFRSYMKQDGENENEVKIKEFWR